MARFRLAASYKNAEPGKRPPLPSWLADELEPEIMALPAKDARRIRYVYYRKIYWATPTWFTEAMRKQMAAIYESAGPGEEVDHIVPLRGKRVCGLNVPWNMQVISREENQQKSNDYWPGMAMAPVDMFDDFRHEPFALELSPNG